MAHDRQHWKEINDVLEKFGHGENGVWLYDFGGSQTVMPIPDVASGSYLTTSCCVILTCPPEKLAAGVLLPSLNERTKDYEPGQRAALVKIKTHCTPEELIKELAAARHKLLGG